MNKRTNDMTRESDDSPPAYSADQEQELLTRDQGLQPFGIYVINHILDKFKKISPMSVRLSPFVFDKESRTFHFAEIMDELWQIKEKKFSAEKLYDFLSGNEDEKGENEDKKVRNALIQSAESHYSTQKAADFENKIDKFMSNGAETLDSENAQKILELLHDLYFSIGAPPEYMAPGIVYRKLKGDFDEAPRIDSVKYFEGVLQQVENNESGTRSIPDIEGKFYYRKPDNEKTEEDEQKELYEQKYEEFDGGWELLLNHFVKDRSKENSWISAVLIGDIWMRGVSHGGFCAVLLLYFDDGKNHLEKSPTQDFFERVPQFQQLCEQIASELYSAGLAKVVSETISRPIDLAHHFVRSLVHVQDWERVTAKRGNKHDFCFHREPDQSWIRCCEKGKCSRDADSSPEIQPLKWEDEKLSIWDRKFVPGLTDEDVAQYRDYTFEFYYPETALLPQSEEDLKQFNNAMFRQQIDVLGLLAPKVRAQRLALRRAVSGIMGRNMSHNIGSHVLARYASKIGTDVVAGGRANDQRSDFLLYLQRRMDFLANVATSDRAFWFQSLSMKQQIDQLNWQEQKNLLKDHNQAEPVLLRFITGKEELKATVEYEEEADVLFACPGGEVGAHALFVILENIIRNSARHGEANDDIVKLKVRASKVKKNSGLLKIEIIDKGSWADKDLVNKINDIIESSLLNETGEPNAKNWGIREMQICAHYLRGFSLYDLEGMPKVLQRKSKKKNYPVLKADGPCKQNKTSKLKYTLYLKRAKRMVLVREQPTSMNEEQLERLGVKIVGKDSPTLKEIGAWAGDYEYLVVEEGVKVPWECHPSSRAEYRLPVRTLVLKKEKIEELVNVANPDSSQISVNDSHKQVGPSEEGDNQENAGCTSWMETLHKCWAEQVRDRRDDWNGKYILGVSLSTNEALKPEPKCEWPENKPDEGLIIAKKDIDNAQTRPLPGNAATWRSKSIGVNGNAIAAVWFDHATEDDFDTGGGGLGQSGEQGSESTRYRWICAENARSGDPHTHFLNDDAQWEILAAAVPRIAVLDERVQSGGVQQSRIKNIKPYEQWLYMGIWTPEKSCCNLDKPNFTQCKNFLKEPTLRCEQYPIDFLVVHLTILEGLARSLGKTVNGTLRSLVHGTQAERAEIVVVTGRGVPAVARAASVSADSRLEGVRYLPISALLESLVDKPSKLGLMRTLWSAGVPTSTNV